MSDTISENEFGQDGGSQPQRDDKGETGSEALIKAARVDHKVVTRDVNTLNDK